MPVGGDGARAPGGAVVVVGAGAAVVGGAAVVTGAGAAVVGGVDVVASGAAVEVVVSSIDVVVDSSGAAWAVNRSSPAGSSPARDATTHVAEVISATTTTSRTTRGGRME
ncbi:MAG TPA: hypothetical protein VI854_04365 [Acidimicrobiia bacterium]|nr:hypothetical protein [Acidimicrobiia bacterium]